MAKVTLGEVAMEARETCKGDRSGFPTVGLEHITPGEIRLSDCDEGRDNTFTKRFHEGDILFGRRRAYLKKAAIAPFEGICSGDITVIRAMQDKMEPRLLPFVIQNDDFFDFAVGRSAGSLSPRVKWEHLKTYSFELPEMDKQRELADVLWAIEDTRAAYQELAAATEELVKSRFVEMFGESAYPSFKLKDICSKITDGTHKTPTYQANGVPFVSAKNIKDGKLLFDNVKYISNQEYDEIQRRCQISNGDLLLTKSGSLGIPALVDVDFPFGIFESLAVLKYDREKINGVFLHSQIRSDRFQHDLAQGVKGIAVKHLHLNVIGASVIIVPPLALQNEFAAFVEQTDKSKFDQLGRSSSCLMKTILRKK